MSRLYTQKQIAAALGVKRQAVNVRARNGRKSRSGNILESPWKIASREKVQGGEAKYYSYDNLPSDVKSALDAWEKAEAERRVIDELNRKAAEDQAAHEREMLACGKSLAEQEAEREREEIVARARRFEEGRRKFNALPKDDQRKRRAKGREWLVLAVLRLHNGKKMPKSAAIMEVANKVNNNEIDVPDFVDQAIHNEGAARALSHGTLKNWVYNYSHSGIGALIPNWGGKPKSKIDTHPELKALVLGALLKYPQITAKSIKDFLKVSHPELNICSIRAIQRFLKKWKRENAQVWTYISHPDQWKNVFMAAAGSVFEHIDRPNQLWELDSTPGDWMLTDGRHSVVGCIDMYSRRVKLFVSKSSTAAAVKQVMRRAMLDWGVPEVVRTDNGKDYVSQDITGLLRDLQITQEICVPFASEEKGTIERFFRTMSHGILNLLDGFIGHNVADRKAIESRKSFAQRIMTKDALVDVNLSSAELQTKLDEWVAHYYEQEPHGGLDGKTPLETWRAWDKPLRKIRDEHALDGLLMPLAGTRIIGKKGIRYNNRFFIDPAGVMFEHVGRESYIKIDEHDIGRIAVSLDDGFLCWAIDPEAQGIDRREAAAAIKHHQKKKVAEQAKELKAFTKSIKSDIVQAVIDHRKAEVENVVDFPRQSEDYSTPALEQASLAYQEQMEPPATRNDQADVIDYDAFRDEFEAHNERVKEEDDLRKIHAAWLRVEQAIENGELVSQEQRTGLEAYRMSGQYQSQQELFEAFGLTAEDFQ